MSVNGPAATAADTGPSTRAVEESLAVGAPLHTSASSPPGLRTRASIVSSLEAGDVQKTFTLSENALSMLASGSSRAVR